MEESLHILGKPLSIVKHAKLEKLGQYNVVHTIKYIDHIILKSMKTSPYNSSCLSVLLACPLLILTDMLMFLAERTIKHFKRRAVHNYSITLPSATRASASILVNIQKTKENDSRGRTLSLKSEILYGFSSYLSSSSAKCVHIHSN